MNDIPTDKVERLNLLGDALVGNRGEDQRRIAATVLEWGCLLLAKNADYGSSVWRAPEIAQGINAGDAILVRLADKWERLKQFAKRPPKIASESREDTIRDLGAYALLWLARPGTDEPPDELLDKEGS